MLLSDTPFLCPCLIAHAVDADDMQHLQAALEQQPLVTIQALELAVRSSNPTELQDCSVLACCCMDLFDRSEAAGSSISSTCTDSWLQRPLMPHVVSLQLSCVKLILAACICAEPPPPAAADVASWSHSAADNTHCVLQAAAAMTSLMAQAARQYRDSQLAAAAPPADSATASGPAASSSTAGSRAAVTISSSRAAADSSEGSSSCQLLMQTTRCFVAAGAALSTLSDTLQSTTVAASDAAAARSHNIISTASNEVQSQISTANVRWFKTLFEKSLVGVEFVQSAVRTVRLPAGEDVLDMMQQQQLLQSLQQLQQEIAAAQAVLGCNRDTGAADGAESTTMHGCTSSISAAELTALLPGLGAQLIVCGESLAVLCPVRLCCNNPYCLELLRGANEVQLVAGKGSVCSRCRWVHTSLRFAFPSLLAGPDRASL
jgi:hypothetical protein